ncbi:hypothetical protein [Qipengyuania spongiae]|uniref:Uncharacterized protein n=1 Tax=Qipengyuania spongiae TaxID=2909673 RepID=A0ABY5T195_9SPHN|nr:hypothetical protein [Qipengyuania spongiae]UVI40572.1 hypothetical protein L1F33_06445 [Qipengyuania spongiae]
MRRTSLGTLACLTLGGMLGGAVPLDAERPASGEALPVKGTGALVPVALHDHVAFVGENLPEIGAAAGMASALLSLPASGTGIPREPAAPERPDAGPTPAGLADSSSLDVGAVATSGDKGGGGRTAGLSGTSHGQDAAQTAEPLSAPPRSEYQVLMGGRDTNPFGTATPALLREIGERIGRDDFGEENTARTDLSAPEVSAPHTRPGAAASEPVRPAIAAVPKSSDQLGVAAIAQAAASPALPGNSGSPAYIEQIGSRPASAYMAQIDPSVQQGRLAVRYGDRALATVAFQVVPGAGMSVHGGQLLDLFRDGIDAPTFARLRNSAASDSFVPLDRLAAEGIPVRYDPVYDEIVIGDAG